MRSSSSAPTEAEIDVDGLRCHGPSIFHPSDCDSHHSFLQIEPVGLTESGHLEDLGKTPAFKHSIARRPTYTRPQQSHPCGHENQKTSHRPERSPLALPILKSTRGPHVQASPPLSPTPPPPPIRQRPLPAPPNTRRRDGRTRSDRSRGDCPGTSCAAPAGASSWCGR